jgi:hypothetical protein
MLAYMMVIALLMMNITGAAHASCIEGALCDGLQLSVIDAADNQGDQGNNQQDASCDCCLSGHHHHFQASILSSKAEHFSASSTSPHRLSGVRYFSQLNYPPSKPPKA